MAHRPGVGGDLFRGLTIGLIVEGCAAAAVLVVLIIVLPALAFALDAVLNR